MITRRKALGYLLALIVPLLIIDFALTNISYPMPSIDKLQSMDDCALDRLPLRVSPSFVETPYASDSDEWKIYYEITCQYRLSMRESEQKFYKFFQLNESTENHYLCVDRHHKYSINIRSEESEVTKNDQARLQVCGKHLVTKGSPLEMSENVLQQCTDRGTLNHFDGHLREQTLSRSLTAKFNLENTIPRFPTFSPTSIPTSTPTSIPTSLPTSIPTSYPTAIPTSIPTSKPTSIPTSFPTSIPTVVPTSVPTSIPTSFPTSIPTSFPTSKPTSIPTSYPTSIPTSIPTGIPTQAPSLTPPNITVASSSSNGFVGSAGFIATVTTVPGAAVVTAAGASLYALSKSRSMVQVSQLAPDGLAMTV